MSSTAVDASVIAFGQRGGYLFESKSKRYSGHLPKAVADVLGAEAASNTLCLALGKGDSYVLTYEDSKGIRYLKTNGIPASLRQWLWERDAKKVLVRQLDKLQVTLGSYNDSYYAYYGKTMMWENIPADLEAAFNKDQEETGTWKLSASPPRLVTLGVDSNYIMITGRNVGSWRLNRYPSLDESIDKLSKQSGGFASIAKIIPNAYRLNSYALVTRSGSVRFNNNMPHAVSAAETITAALKGDVEKEQAEAKRKKEEDEWRQRLADMQTRQMIQARQAQQLRMLQMQHQQAELQAMQNAFAMHSMMNSWNNFRF